MFNTARIDHPFEPHDASNLFPLMDEAELAELTQDIREHGLLEPIVLYEGRVLDGRNRLLACQRAGVEPEFLEWTGGASPTSWVLSMNLKRRHLSASQRAMIASDATVLYEAEARARQLAGVPAHVQEGGEAVEHAARDAGVSPRSVYGAQKVKRHGAPELMQAVRDGQVSVRAAADIATMPHEEQQVVVARGEKAIIAEAKKIRQRRAEARREKKEEVAKRIGEEPPPLPGGPFRVIVIDPPWRYDATVDSDPGLRGTVPYADMDVDQICALPVAGLARQDCVLWLWTTNAFLREAYRCLDSWGFVAKTLLTWDKERIGLGHWLRNVTEHCILAVRGKPVVRLAGQSTLIREPRRDHSRKPESFYRLVNELCPGSKLEMFARQTRDGWQTWGGEAAKYDA